jgi:hypothetical protein
MTSFTECVRTSFTLSRKRCERGSRAGDALEDDGCPRTTGELCGGGQSRREAVERLVPGIRDLAANRLLVAVALARTGFGGHRGIQPASGEESGDAAEVEEQVVALRTRYPDWGQVLLQQRGLELARNTIHPTAFASNALEIHLRVSYVSLYRLISNFEQS